MCLAVPGQVVAVQDDLLRTGTVSFAGITKTVSLAMVPEASVGDYVLVHVGFAIATVDQQEARTVFEYLRQMGELTELAGEGTP